MITPVHLVGASSLLAGEFLRLLANHPALVLAGAYRREAGATLRRWHPQLAPPLADQEVLPVNQVASRLTPEAVVVLALPHGVSAQWVAAHRSVLERQDVTLLDLSADFRLQSEAAYRSAYPDPHPCPDQLGQWQYGLPELHPVSTKPRRVAVAGCFATAMQLATVPGGRQPGIDRQSCWVLHGVTGSTGSGLQAKSTTHHPHRDGNFRAYSLGGHRHEAELLAPRNFSPLPRVDFTPHSGPFRRGIHLHAVLPLLAAGCEVDWFSHYQNFYRQAPFVEVQESAPELRQVVGSNRVVIGVQRRDQQLHLLCVLDNTLKGGAGQAMQCLNLLLGLPQTTALPLHAWGC